MKKKTVAIIHYNTPELTMAAIGSLLKNGGGPFRVVVFDNSDTRPFEGATNVQVFDNTKGQIIDFDAELEKYPERDRSIGCAKGCEFGSVKHMMTVQKLWELLPQGFVLMESDVLIKKNIDEFFDEGYSVYGYCQKAQPHNPFGIGRMLPMLCWMNVPMLTREGAMYFDPTRTYGLLPGGRQNRNNWYDTGAVLLEDILTKRPRLKGYHRDIREFVEHYGSGSWAKNDLSQQMAWLEQHKNLLPTADENVRLPLRTKVAVCAIVRNENRYLREWIEWHKGLGVDKFFIYDNGHGNDENPRDVIGDDPQVVIIDWRDRDGNTQCEAYDECYRNHGSEFDWMGFIDIDEFVRSEMPLPDVLNTLQADVVAFSWRMMTDNGLVHYDPRPVQERFTQPAEDLKPESQFVKSFVRGGIEGLSFDRDPHMPHRPALEVVNPDGGKAPQCSVGTGSREVAWIDHHFTKTAEEFAQKVSRSWPAIHDERIIEKEKNAVNHFFRFNERTAEKEEILGVGKKKTRGKAASKREQSQIGLNSAEREQANQSETIGKPKTQKRANNKTK